MSNVCVADLEQLLDGALDHFDGADGSVHGQVSCADGALKSSAPTCPASANALDGTLQETLQSESRKALNKGSKFDPLAKKPKKRKPELSHAVINDMQAVNQEELDSSTKDLALLFDKMMKENCPTADLSSGSVCTPSLASTLDEVNQTARKAAESSTAETNPSSDESASADLQQMLECMQGLAGGENGNMDSFVETLMHHILSKEVLYEPLKDISRRFPEWLERNASTLTPEEESQHRSQLTHINEICRLLEDHGDSQFDELLKLLQELQAMGQPPQELLEQMQAACGSSSPDTPLGPLSEQCPMQ